MTFAKFISSDGQVLPAHWSTTEKHLRAVASGKTRSVSIGLSETGADTYFIACFVKPSGIYVSARELTDPDDYHLFDSSKVDDLVSCVVGGRTGSVLGRSSIVDEATLLLAARTYFERGGREATLTWRSSLDVLQRLEREEHVGSLD